MDTRDKRMSPFSPLLLVVALAACASGGGAEAATEAEPGPLRAWFEEERPGAARVSFHLSKPAYPAVFEMVPGEELRVLYPTRPVASEDQRSFSAGDHTERFRAFGPRVRSGLPRNPACPAAAYRLLVASERPLDLEALGRSIAYRSRPATGVSDFPYQPQQAFQVVLDTLLPEGGGAHDMSSVSLRC